MCLDVSAFCCESEERGETFDENYYIYQNVYYKRRKKIVQQLRSLSVLLFSAIQRRSSTLWTDLQQFKML
jgi:hypothetical protein